MAIDHCTLLAVLVATGNVIANTGNSLGPAVNVMNETPVVVLVVCTESTPLKTPLPACESDAVGAGGEACAALMDTFALFTTTRFPSCPDGVWYPASSRSDRVSDPARVAMSGMFVAVRLEVVVATDTTAKLPLVPTGHVI